jgi:hypothetical protein
MHMRDAPLVATDGDLGGGLGVNGSEGKTGEDGKGFDQSEALQEASSPILKKGPKNFSMTRLESIALY